MNDYKIIGKVSGSTFFRSLAVFATTTTIFIEGASIATDILSVYKKHEEKGLFLPRSEILFSRSIKLRCSFSVDFLNEVSLKAKFHAEPELLDHFYLYKDDVLMLTWTDAFFDEMTISHIVPKEVVDRFIVISGMKIK